MVMIEKIQPKINQRKECEVKQRGKKGQIETVSVAALVFIFFYISLNIKIYIVDEYYYYRCSPVQPFYNV